jgi:putative DNA primase/helicase
MNWTERQHTRQTAVYPYRDEQGRVLYEVVRYEPKDFRQRVPLEGGGYQWRLDGVRRVPYRLPELLAADPLWEVFIVEGEKDADRLASVGCTTTTNVGGAGQWRPEYAQWLKDRSVVIIPDNDEPGKRHAEQVARTLVGIAGRISILELPGLEPKGDVSDFMQGDPDARMTELVKHMLDAPDWIPTEETATSYPDNVELKGCPDLSGSRPNDGHDGAWPSRTNPAMESRGRCLISPIRRFWIWILCSFSRPVG